ncbi:hypothetical protein VTJ04DRAFT_9304 [Mycothermus thermophilus]|uniref:uncharacterized protein n=1 Tax=Humicola insolens TaxID=85995 RepID=UPI003742E797
MPLYAAGFNAWNQLCLQPPDSVSDSAEPDDITSFACVFPDQGIRCVRPFLSYTRDIQTKAPKLTSLLVELENGQSKIAGLVPGDHQRLLSQDKNTYATFAEASNDTVVVVSDQDSKPILKQYPSLPSLLANPSAPSDTFPLPSDPSSTVPTQLQLVSYATGFAVLDKSTGHVWTWGDERYVSCLGRDVTEESPAHHPHPVPSLLDLPTGPITKLASNPLGYVLAALTSGGDVYCWGDVTRNGGALSHCSCLNLSENFGAPVPIVIQNNHAHNQQQEAEAEEEEDGKDIADIAVGDAHMLALTRDGEVYVLGDNSNGQLGMDPQAVGSRGSGDGSDGGGGGLRRDGLGNNLRITESWTVDTLLNAMSSIRALSSSKLRCVALRACPRLVYSHASGKK